MNFDNILKTHKMAPKNIPKINPKITELVNDLWKKNVSDLIKKKCLVKRKCAH